MSVLYTIILALCLAKMLNIRGCHPRISLKLKEPLVLPQVYLVYDDMSFSSESE